MGWTISFSEDPVLLTVVAILIVASALLAPAVMPRWRRQARCPHSRYIVTRAGDAICLDCGRNHGDVQKWRERQIPDRPRRWAPGP